MAKLTSISSTFIYIFSILNELKFVKLRHILNGNNFADCLIKQFLDSTSFDCAMCLSSTKTQVGNLFKPEPPLKINNISKKYFAKRKCLVYSTKHRTCILMFTIFICVADILPPDMF